METYGAVKKISTALNATLESWNIMAHNQDSGKPEWVRGVIYGITLCIRIVAHYE